MRHQRLDQFHRMRHRKLLHGAKVRVASWRMTRPMELVKEKEAPAVAKASLTNN